MQRHYRITVDGQPYDVTVEDAGAGAPAPPQAQPAAGPLPAPAAPPPFRGASGQNLVTAPLPGVVLEVKVRQGQRVQAGDVLLILEAMKMENEITAPSGGTVRRVAVEQGATVGLGDLLVELG